MVGTAARVDGEDGNGARSIMRRAGRELISPRRETRRPAWSGREVSHGRGIGEGGEWERGEMNLGLGLGRA